MAKNGVIWVYTGLLVFVCCNFDKVMAKNSNVMKSNNRQRPLLNKGRKKRSPVHKGKLLIGVYECLSCHSLDGKGNKDGLALDNTNRSKTFLIEHIMDPETHVEKNPKAYNNETNLMPSYQLSRKEAADIADYLLSLTRSTPKKKKNID